MSMLYNDMIWWYEMETEYQQFNGSFCLSNSNGKRRLFISIKNLDISFKIFVSANRRFILVKRLVLASGLRRSFRSWYRDMFREHGLHLRLLDWRMKNDNSAMISRVPLFLVEHPAQIRCRMLLLLAYPSFATETWFYWVVEFMFLVDLPLLHPIASWSENREHLGSGWLIGFEAFPPIPLGTFS